MVSVKFNECSVLFIYRAYLQLVHALASILIMGVNYIAACLKRKAVLDVSGQSSSSYMQLKAKTYFPVDRYHVVRAWRQDSTQCTMKIGQQDIMNGQNTRQYKAAVKDAQNKFSSTL
jgi:hypothetical protein